MTREIHFHVSLRHLAVLTLIIGLALGAIGALVFSLGRAEAASSSASSYGPAGKLRIANTINSNPVSCGYFGSCTASSVNFTVPSTKRADLVVLFTGNAEADGACHVIPLLDGANVFGIDPQIFVPHTATGESGTEHWTLGKVPAGAHTVSIVFSEVVDSMGHCSIDASNLTVLVNIHS